MIFTDRPDALAQGLQYPADVRTSRGSTLANVIEPEGITCCIPVREFPDDKFLFFATAQGQVEASFPPTTIRAGGIKAIKLAEDDHLVNAVVTDGSNEVVLASRLGQAVRFASAEVRPMGRFHLGWPASISPRPTRLSSLVVRQEGVTCSPSVSAVTASVPPLTTTASPSVAARVSPISTPTSATVRWWRAWRSPGHEIMLMSRGMVVRTDVDDIRQTGRVASGVRIINLGDEDSLTGGCESDSGDERRGVRGPGAQGRFLRAFGSLHKDEKSPCRSAGAFL